MKRLWMIAVLVGAALPAWAQVRVTLPARMPMQRHSVRAGAGVVGYYSGGAPGTSGAWDVRYNYAAHPLLSIEGGYLGAAGDGPGPGGVVATVLEGDVRFTPLRGAQFSPYLLAGAGYGAFSGTGGFQGDNRTVVVPLGLGADWKFRENVIAGARFTHRIVARDNVGPTGAGTDHWSLIANVGTAF